jgi:hypothetical protein
MFLSIVLTRPFDNGQGVHMILKQTAKHLTILNTAEQRIDSALTAVSGVKRRVRQFRAELAWESADHLMVDDSFRFPCPAQ